MLVQNVSQPRKKQSTGPSKLPGRSEFTQSSEGDGKHTDEVFYLGHREDKMYLCEKSARTFRVLRLSPARSAP